MGATTNAERVATLVAAVSLSIAMTGPAAHADTGSHRAPKHSESSTDNESSSATDDSSSSGERTTSPGRTPISVTRAFPGRTDKPFENASPNGRFPPPANSTGEGTRRQPPGKFVFGRHDCAEQAPEPPQEPDPPAETDTPPQTTPEQPRLPSAPVLPKPQGGSGYTPSPPEFHQPTVTFSMPEQAPETVPDEPAAEPPAVSEPEPETPVIVALEAPVIPAPVATPTRVPVEITASPAATITSRVGTGAMALTAILIVLMTGVWFYGNRLASHLTRRNDHG